MKPRFSVFTSSVLVVLAILLANPVFAQDDEKRGLLTGHLGRSSTVESSGATRTVLGASVAFKLFESRNLYAEPGFFINWPGNENLFLEGAPFRMTAKTYTVDFNLSQALVRKSKEEVRCQPYITGGVGFIRNSVEINDGYYLYNLGSDTHFSKNLGLGFRFFLGENRDVFVAGEWKNYWSGGGNFHVFTGGMGLRF